MHLNFRVFLLILFFVGMSTPSSFGTAPRDKKQRIVSRQKFNQAEKLLNNRNYSKASVIYKELLEKTPRNAILNFKLGTCYLNIVGEKEKSVALLEKAVEYTSSKNNIPVDVYFNLGKAYHTNYQFRKALRVFKDLLQIISIQNVDFREEINREIKMCENGLDLVQHPVNISIINLGNKINTEFAEHSPGVTADESTMIFTSRRNGTGSKVDNDGQYFEDIYISTFENGQWTTPKGIKKLNTIDHDASISVSADGQELYIYKAGYYNRKESEGGDIYVSHLQGDKWSNPEKLNPTINSSSKETHISVSADGKSIYFTSDRPGGYGGLDVYIVNKLPNGNWGMARNLGPVINTEYDEDGPFIHPDGKTLYFSSRGHETMGGLDIFKSVNIGGRWSTPMNIGYPINSTDDDVYYTPTPDGKRAYFSSHRKGSLGRTDIFLIKTPEEEKKGLFVLKGKVVTTSGQPVGNSRITVTYNRETIGIYNPNTASGKFLFIIEAGKTYDIEILAEGFRTLRTRLNIPPEYANTENHSVITLLPLTLKTQGETNYSKSLELIDFEKSKIPDVYITPSDTTTIPDIKEFDKAAEPMQKDSTATVQESQTNPLPNTQDSALKTKNTTLIPTSSQKDSLIALIDSEASSLPNKTDLALKDTDTSLKSIEDKKSPKKEKDPYPVTTKKKTSSSKGGTNVPLVGVPPTPITSGRVNSTLPVLRPKNKKSSPKVKKTKTVVTETRPQGSLSKKEPIEALSKLSSNLSYTIELGALAEPASHVFKDLQGIRVQKGKDDLYHYTIGNVKNYKEALKLKQKLQKKGFNKIKVRILDQNNQLIEASSKKGEIYYTIQLMALQLPVDKEFFNQLENVKVFQGNDGITRYTYLRFSSFNDALEMLDRVIRMGYWDAFIRTVIDNHPVDPKSVYQPEALYTIQVMALREPRNLNFFNDLGKVNMLAGSDGLYRYTYRTYRSKMEAQIDLNKVIRKGYWDAFVRKAYRGETSLDEPIVDHGNYYTIQVMALRNAKSLSFFKDLDVKQMNKYRGKDGITRYTFQKFNSKTQALGSLSFVLSKGYWDAFTREIKWYKK
ncbi:MAG: hypothetical protein ACEPOZ_04125 [Marinifilaceae bacterium]